MSSSPLVRAEARAAWLLCAPALAAIATVALFPLGYSLWESLQRHDLRQPPGSEHFVGLPNYVEALSSPRFWRALGHTLAFTVVSVGLELALGLCLALILHRAFAGRGLLRTVALLPWALPTVVAALVWRFLFEGAASPANDLWLGLSWSDQPVAWLTDRWAAWTPILLADVWKTTPFVALLLLAGLQNIDPSLYEAARCDGAGRWQELWHLTLPLLRPAFVVVLLFRSLDALRVFDLIYVLTSGGPGTATEPIALYAFSALFRSLRFGYGSAISVLVFTMSLAAALLYLRAAWADLLADRE